ncbi:hypothetical protein [Streptosporangium carneum]|uniref:Glycosyltransferase RgtA/B/C/D-like domain-containing protein n=1 Tax=Streptosporangium carneum TaxID=47481 RepID=A0A9W6IBG5_9ACTN|nr:hypothetical protein [Streptosporangium carneum]GLK15322.1 hypothetical protein GCM10017600_87350 [Streptosporangium carneum]
MEYVFVAAAAVALVFLVHVNFGAETVWKALPVLLVAFTARIAVHVLLMRNGGNWYGGDNLTYEFTAAEIVEEWKRSGVHFVDTGQGDALKSVAVPCNLFAFIMYLCGGKAALACTAAVALLACGLCIVMYRFARLLGADDRSAFLLLVISAFTPAFLVHTSDMFKDGFNAFLVVACLGLACSNLRRFDIRKLAVLAPLLWALWHVRPYMVFMCAPSLALSLMGSRRAPSLRAVALLSVLLAAVLALVGGAADGGPFGTMQEQLEYGQSDDLRRAVANEESGVTFEDSGSPWGALGPKLLYTLLSPFPWMEGSMTLQLGKLEVIVWYYLLYSAVRGARRLWSRDRGMFWTLLLFIVPSMVVYATTMANIGLIFRQRMPIIMVTSLLSAIAWTRTPEREGSGEPREEEGSPAPRPLPAIRGR